MTIDKQALLLNVEEILSLSNGEKSGSIADELLKFVRHFWDFNLIVEVLMTDKQRKWDELFLVAQFFNTLIDYSEDDCLTRSGLINDATRLYAKSFTLCPRKQRHHIAYGLLKLIEKTYHTGYVTGSSSKFYFCDFVATFDFYSSIHYYHDVLPQEPLQWPSTSNNHRLGNVFQLYLLKHVLDFDANSLNPLVVDKEKYLIDLDKWQHNTSKLTEKEIKQTAKFLLGNLLESVADEEIDWFTFENDEFWKVNEDGKVYMRDLNEEMRIQQEEVDTYGHILTDFPL